MSSPLQIFVFFFAALLLLSSCAISEPDFGPEENQTDPDVGALDAMDDPGDADDPFEGDTDSQHDGDTPPEHDGDANDTDDGPIDLCPFGCDTNETCTDDGCVDLCAEAGHQCGQWTLQGIDINCGSCPSGLCDQGQCSDICADFSAQCGEVYWAGQAYDCGDCSGVERCRNHQCAAPDHFVDITLGDAHSCALRPDGSARCWGRNNVGQLGDNNEPTGSSSPRAVTGGLADATDISSLHNHTCAALASGQARCWGDNTYGGLGNLSTTPSDVPVSVSNLTGVAAVATGGSHSCALTSNGRLRCWGYNGQGQLGKGDVDGEQPVHDKNEVRFISSLPFDEAHHLSLGSAHSCALRRDNTAWCWGFNHRGQLGRSDTASKSLAAQVDISAPVHHLETGTNHSCAIVVGGDVYCWGSGGDGQLGHGSSPTTSPTPAQVNLPGPAISLSAGRAHTCAALASGQVYCWGDNEYGQLGRGSFGASFHSPQLVSGVNNVHIVATGGHHSCALNRQGQLRCWGRNHEGQLGDSTTTNRNSPTTVAP